MLTNINWQLQKSPPIWLWFLTFIISIFAIFIFGINPEYLEKYWLHLALYNATIILVAVFYIIKFLLILNRQKKHKIIGSKFTLGLAKIIPILTVVPVLSFYAFSFQTVQDNLQIATSNVDRLNTKIYDEANNIHQKLRIIKLQEYIDSSTEILKTIHQFIEDETNYPQNITNILARLSNNKNICRSSIFVNNQEIATSIIIKDCDIWGDYKVDNKSYLANDKTTKNTIFTQLPLKSITRTIKNIVLVVYYKKTGELFEVINRINNFKLGIKNASITLNSVIIKRQFLVDFSTTILLTLLSVLIIVLKMVEKIMIPLNNLSIASKKISKGEYGVLVDKSTQDDDIKNLIDEFNQMSKQIKQSKIEIDDKNSYLESIIQYSSGIITTDENLKINLVNNKILSLLKIKNKNIIGKTILELQKENRHLKKIFKQINEDFASKKVCNKIIEFDKLLLDCQGATLENNNKIIGYMLIIKDISNIRKTQKLVAWNEVARRMAHEIKNPLNPILLSAQRLRNKFLPDKDENNIINKTTKTIIAQVNSINNIVNSFAEYDINSKQQYTMESLNKIIKNTINLYEGQINISTELADIDKLKLDTNSINRILINLIKNSIEADSKNIYINTKQHAQIITLTIADDGNGFDNSIVETIFEPYITSKKSGTGLGMAIVEKVINNHNADINIDKNYQNGAKFIINFYINNLPT